MYIVMAFGDNMKVFGPYKRKDGRKLVIVVDKNGRRRTVSYPKWLMELHLGRQLHPDECTVDHIDSDFNNNDFSNLRLVPREEHSGDDTRRVKNLKFDCAWCDTNFERSPRLIRDKAKKNRAGPFCSRSCAGKYSRMLQLKLIDKLNPQQHVESEYYKRKNVIASSYSDFEPGFSFLELLSFASSGVLEKKLLALRGQMASAAQKVLDEWVQDDEGLDEQFGSGGACDSIAQVLSGIVSTIPDVEITDGGHDGDDHAYIIVYNDTEAYEVDIPPSVYEIGSGYVWKKRPGVILGSGDVVIEPLDRKFFTP